MAYIKIFKASDDSVVSEEGVFTNSIDFTLRADLEESDSIRLYAMADQGYSVGTTVVSFTGTSASKWALAPDSAGSEGTYEDAGDPLTLGTVGYDTGKVYFWAKASAADDEEPINDTSVLINVEGIAEAV